MSIYTRSETYVHRVTIKNRSNVRVNPSTVSETILDPCDVTIVNQASMPSDATGEYYYNFPIPSAATFGRYNVKTDATSAGGNVAIIKDEFFVLPWDAVQDVRQTMGLSETKGIEDKDVANIIWNCYKFTLRDMHEHHYKESPNGNPDTGVEFDGANTTFQTRYHPIADIDGDGSVTGNNVSCATDIDIWWVNSSGQRQTGIVTITDAVNGEISLYQSDGSTAIPSDNEGVYLDYWVEYDGFDTFLFRQAVVRLVCHEISKRFASLDRMTLADIRASNQLLIVNPTMFMDEYRRYINQLRKPLITGV